MSTITFLFTLFLSLYGCQKETPEKAIPIQRIMLCGDSRLVNQGYFENKFSDTHTVVANYSEGGRRMIGVWLYQTDTIDRFNPTKIIISAGGNDLASRTSLLPNEYWYLFLDHFKDKKIVLVMPMAFTKAKMDEIFFPMSDLITYNDSLRRMVAMHYPNVRIYTPSNIFYDSTGYLDMRLSSDGVHQNAAGFEQLSRELRKWIYYY